MSAFEKVIGYETIKAKLMCYADVLKNLRKYKELGVEMPSGILLFGEPGVGKSTMAKAFIEETGLKSYIIRKEKPDGDFVKHIKAVYDEAKNNSPSIVFLDDMDKYSNEDDDRKNTEEHVTIQSCIDECKGFNVFTFATVNDLCGLPDSLLRVGRFDEIIETYPPDGKDAEDIIKKYISQKKHIGKLDYEELSKIMEYKSCAELETIINKAALYAGYEGKEMIDQQDIIKACIDDVFPYAEIIKPEDTNNLLRVSIHEAGHMVVSEVLEPGSVTFATISKNAGGFAGMTYHRHVDESLISYEKKKHEIIYSLGGKAATEIILGEDDMGCEKDIRDVYSILVHFIDVGALGFEMSVLRIDSEHLSDSIERKMISEVEKYYKIARQIIIENRKLYDAFQKELNEKQTLTYRDIERIKNSITEQGG